MLLIRPPWIEIGPRHDFQLQAIADGGRHRHAEHAAGVAHHEIDGLRRRLFGGDDQVALILAIFVIDQDDHASGSKFGQRALD